MTELTSVPMSIPLTCAALQSEVWVQSLPVVRSSPPKLDHREFKGGQASGRQVSWVSGIRTVAQVMGVNSFEDFTHCIANKGLSLLRPPNLSESV